jgi:hypothetical protein
MWRNGGDLRVLEAGAPKNQTIVPQVDLEGTAVMFFTSYVKLQSTPYRAPGPPQVRLLEGFREHVLALHLGQ